mmetsp:Transcript_107290/g.212983  ORF Transcript_107290/g.212983 Transcript_107290/m.212983 type:complete len:96 (+) Transcript_107290:307-594(+)
MRFSASFLPSSPSVEHLVIARDIRFCEAFLGEEDELPPRSTLAGGCGATLAEGGGTGEAWLPFCEDETEVFLRGEGCDLDRAEEAPVRADISLHP